jgi:hypothetical protein
MQATQAYVESNRHLGTRISWRRSILIAGGEISILQTPRMAFEHEGYNVTSADDSVRALELLTGIATLID